jgi:ketosteroid isomerase-like protein
MESRQGLERQLAGREVVRAWIESFNRRDLEALLELSSEDLRLHPYLATLIEDATYVGHRGIREYFRDADEAWEEIRLRVPGELQEDGELLVGPVEIYGRARSSGLEANVSVHWVVRVAQGQVASIEAQPIE